MKAKQLLNEYHGIDYQLVELDKINYGLSLAIDLKTVTGQTSVPNIFIYGKHIGGYSELLTLHKNGELRVMLQNGGKSTLKYVCETCGKGTINNQFSCNCFQLPFGDWGEPL
jgi:glutaredoxin 3|tara:strand:+ start:3939 stop:4274 length:336 start_codon:yes stop_codon:yes gene_type:complete